MSAPGQSAQAKLDAKVREVGLELLTSLHEQKFNRDGTITFKVVELDLNNFRVAVNAANALASVLAEEEPGK